ncbi:MAG TPA: GNAT family N-acetyltransferase [Acidimicrobiales bacterium]|nr:GNAT family N-acetyltransferase [Acidimicrobiales bacterium]
MDEPTTIAATTAPVPPGYPAAWEADVVLADGGTARIRPIRPDDGPRVVDFHGRQSPESIYFRYFTPRPRLPEQEVERLTHIDYVDRMAFVALRDDVLVGVARYDRLPTRSEAEVAFFVDDRHQGRGIATVLLEYLAEAARRSGITAFTATVLPSNGRMVAVFRNAGFITASRFGDGVIEVRLDLQPTPEAEAAITTRAQRAEAEAVRRLLAPRSVAVIGAGRDPSGVGHAVLRNLLEHEFAGPVHAVNPTADHVAGVRAVHHINDIDEPVDLAIVVVPASQVPAAVEDCGRKGVAAVIVISAGFAEAGPEGAALSAAAVRAARRFGTRLLGPNCLGVINTDPQVRLHATFATPNPRPGPVALLSESGTIGGVILDHIGDAGLGASSFAAIGNRADVSANDMLQYWADDSRTELVLLYLESFGNARKFSRIARELGRTKPIVAVKSRGAARAYPADGAPEAEPSGEARPERPWEREARAEARAARSEAARAGSLPRRDAAHPTAVEALLEQTGVVRVDTLSQLLDVARVLACQPLPDGDRVALVGNGGGSLALAADACLDAGLVLAELGTGVRRQLDAGQPGSRVTTRLRASTVDLGFEAGADDLERALLALLGDEGVDSVLVVCAPAPRQSTADLVRAVASARAARAHKTLLACVFGPHPTSISPASGADVPVFDFPDAAAYALGRVTQYARWRRAPGGEVVVPPGADPAAGRAQVAAALAGGGVEEGGRWLSTDVAVDVLTAAGLPIVPSRVARDRDQALAAAGDLGYPVAVKSAARSRSAKTEAGGIALDVHDQAELLATLEGMGGALGDALWPLVVQPMVDPGIDVAITVAETELVGPVVTLGAGGVATDLSATEVHVLPLTDFDARRFVASSPLGRLLDEAGRGDLEDLLQRVGALIETAPEVVGLELNPVIVSPSGPAVADVRLRVAPIERDSLPPVRRI